MVVACACRAFTARPGSGTVLGVLRRFRPTLVVVAGFCIGLALQSFDKVLPRYASMGGSGGAATLAKIVDWTAPPLAGALLAAALLAAQRYKRLHDAERAASRVLADRLTGVERRQALWVVAASIIGARVVHVIANISFYADNPGDIFAIWHGGLSSFGGLLFAVPVAIVLARRRCPELATSRALDLVAPLVFVAFVIVFSVKLIVRPRSTAWAVPKVGM